MIRSQNDPANMAEPKKNPDAKHMTPKSKIAQNKRSATEQPPATYEAV